LPSRHRIQCINRSDRYDPHQRITHVGGLNGNGTQWRVSQPEAIAGIERRQWSLFVEQPAGDPVEVVVAVSPYGHKYLKTTADDDQPNDLLSLPECS
jgi:Protein of unknown function (DUF3892)